ncbi:hypothetical protein Fmac_028599 [Flemingia macrophylla]|uniref:BHLH domain-containing protein n=1 Tax=Flemingia macrophylla TaxID=520843 RepID=A0ABD1L7Z0_9FABA
MADHHSSRDKALDREDGSELLAIQSARNDAIAIRGVHDVATIYNSLKLESGRQARCSCELGESISCESKPASRSKRVHDVATRYIVEARKLESRLDGLVNLVTQLAANQKPASVARVCGIYSSNDHNPSVCPSSQQSAVDEHPEADGGNTYSRPPQQ